MATTAEIMLNARRLGIGVPAFNVPYLPMMQPVVHAVVDQDAFALIEVARLESPERIVEAAEAQGMIVPTDPTWLTIRPDGGADATTTSEEGAGDVRAEGDGDPTGDAGDERADGGPGGSGG